MVWRRLTVEEEWLGDPWMSPVLDVSEWRCERKLTVEGRGQVFGIAVGKVWDFWSFDVLELPYSRVKVCATVSARRVVRKWERLNTAIFWSKERSRTHKLLREVCGKDYGADSRAKSKRKWGNWCILSCLLNEPTLSSGDPLHELLWGIWWNIFVRQNDREGHENNIQTTLFKKLRKRCVWLR